MYHLSPYTYVVEALVGNGEKFFLDSPLTAIHPTPVWHLGLGGQQIACSDVEYAIINPPAGLTCSQYMNPYMSRAGGYITNPESTSACQFCPFRSTDQFLDLSLNIKYSNRWRDVGIFIAFIVLNVRVPGLPAHAARGLTWPVLQVASTYLFTYLFRMKRWDESRLFNWWRESTPKLQPRPAPKHEADEVV